ncbi:hypothetical protein ACFFLM_10160 [Deinococcus oregonensis]|uniref:Spore coat protein U domain-containing protein n=1 Tax=Deinococcus oregonensis TaxID=1805970 RepID=A0ABV6AXU6_9DEIO
MKKMMLLAAVLSTSFALAGRAPESASTNMVFGMDVVAGCAVSLADSYSSSPEDATYSGTDATAAVLNITAGNEGAPNFRCQTGTQMTLKSTSSYALGNTADTVLNEQKSASGGGNPFNPTGNTLTTSGRLSLIRAGGVLNNDDKTLEGNYTVTLAEDPFQNGQNGDTWNLSATFQADEGQFEPAIGEYSGTVYVTVDYN